MYYINTEKSLLGINKFKVSKTITTKKDFRDKVLSIVKELLKKNPDYSDHVGFVASDFTKESSFEEMLQMIAGFLFDFSEYEDAYVPKEMDNLLTLFKDQECIDCGVSLLDLDFCVESMGEDYEDNYKLSILKKDDLSFPYLQIYSCVGDDGLIPVASILYFDENEKLNLYIPVYGNTYFHEVKSAAGGYDYFDDDARMYVESDLAKSMGISNTTEFLGDKITDKSVIWEYDFLEAYRQKYGVVKVRHDNTNYFNDDIPNFFVTYLLVSKRRIKEDILSNIE